MTADQPSRVDDIVNELRRRVAERRASGFYPEGLEEDLEGHFRRLVGQRTHPDVDTLRADLRRVEACAAFSTESIPTDSTIPGGAAMHRAVARLVARQTQGVVEQLQKLAFATRDALIDVADFLEDPNGHVHGDLVGQLDAVFERLAAFERGPGGSDAAVGDLRRRVEALEAAEERRSFRPPFRAAAFEEAFRGSDADLKDRYRDLAQHFVDRGPVLDIGCGRGEFLELLRELDVDARGIEIDADLVAEATAAGLDVELGDAVTYLASEPDRSLGGITLLQVIEHLTPQGVVDLVSVARPKLRPDGLILIETVNPQSLYTFAHSFYLDPTHANPVHPAYLKFLFEEAGYRDVTIDWRSPPPDEDVLEVDESAGEVAAANVRRLNQLLFAPQDYALLARP